MGSGGCTLTFLFEGKFTLLIVVLVLSTTSIFTTLEDVLAVSLVSNRHGS